MKTVDKISAKREKKIRENYNKKLLLDKNNHYFTQEQEMIFEDVNKKHIFRVLAEDQEVNYMFKRTKKCEYQRLIYSLMKREDNTYYFDYYIIDYHLKTPPQMLLHSIAHLSQNELEVILYMISNKNVLVSLEETIYPQTSGFMIDEYHDIRFLIVGKPNLSLVQQLFSIFHYLELKEPEKIKSITKK